MNRALVIPAQESPLPRAGVALRSAIARHMSYTERRS